MKKWQIENWIHFRLQQYVYEILEGDKKRAIKMYESAKNAIKEILEND